MRRLAAATPASCRGNPPRTVKDMMRRFLGVLPAFMPAIAVLITALASRPSAPPPVGGLDSAVEMFFPYWQSRHGLELAGHYSWTLQTFHPGPLYPWLSVLGGSLSSAALGSPWFAWGAWLAVAAAVVVAYTTAWIIARTIVRPAVADTAFAAIIVWALTRGDGEWFSHITLNTPHWGPTLSPPFALLAIVTTWKALRHPSPGTHAGALLSTGLLAQTTIGVTPLAATLALLVIVGMFQRRRARRHLAAATAAAVAGWWWVLARAATEGPLFFLPPAGTSPVQPGLDGGSDPISAQWAARAVSEHTGVHPAAAAVITAGLLVVARLRRRRSETLLAAVVAAIGWGQIFLLFPQRFTAYQSAWVEPVWVGGVVMAVAVLAGRSALMRRLAPSRRLCSAAAGLAFAAYLAAPGNLDPARALNLPYEAFPAEVFERVATAVTADGKTATLVVRLGPAPELHGAAAMWFSTRDIGVCLSDVASQPGGRSPLDRLRCTVEDQAGAGYVLVADTAAAVPGGEPLWGISFPYRGAQRWELYRASQ